MNCYRKLHPTKVGFRVRISSYNLLKSNALIKVNSMQHYVIYKEDNPLTHQHINPTLDLEYWNFARVLAQAAGITCEGIFRESTSEKGRTIVSEVAWCVCTVIVWHYHKPQPEQNFQTPTTKAQKLNVVKFKFEIEAI